MKSKTNRFEKSRLKAFLLASKSMLKRSDKLEVYKIISPALCESGFRQLDNESQEEHCLRYLESHQRRIVPSKRKMVKIVSPESDKIRQVVKPRRVLTKCKVDVTTDSFLSTLEWKQIRMLALKTYGNVCQCCGANPSTGAVLNVDHIKPRKLHPELALDITNLQILCSDCNHGKGNWDDTDWR